MRRARNMWRQGASGPLAQLSTAATLLSRVEPTEASPVSQHDITAKHHQAKGDAHLQERGERLDLAVDEQGREGNRLVVRAHTRRIRRGGNQSFDQRRKEGGPAIAQVVCPASACGCIAAGSAVAWPYAKNPISRNA